MRATCWMLTIAACAALTAAAAGPKPAPKAAPSGGAAAGKKVYATAGCAMCHAIGGKGSGKDLSHIGARKKAAWLTTQIRSPKKNNPGSPMPAFDKARLSDRDLASLVAYLASQK